MEHRAEVRDALGVDKKWISVYVVNLLPMLAEQVNSVVVEPEWALPLKSKSKKGPFMLERIQFAGEARENEEAVKALVTEKLDTFDLTNVLFTDVGPNNEGMQFHNLTRSILSLRQPKCCLGLFYDCLKFLSLFDSNRAKRLSLSRPLNVDRKQYTLKIKFEVLAPC